MNDRAPENRPQRRADPLFRGHPRVAHELHQATFADRLQGLSTGRLLGDLGLKVPFDLLTSATRLIK